MKHQSAAEPGGASSDGGNGWWRTSIGYMWVSTGRLRPIRPACWTAAGASWPSALFAHTGDAIAAFAQWLHEVAGDEPGQVAIAIEIPRGAGVETLVERGFHVYAITPKQLDRFRDRHNVAGATDDRRDAFVLGDSVRTERA